MTNDSPLEATTFGHRLQRFVDGEMTDAQERVFLQECETRADGWRSLGLALAEERLWKSVCQDMTEEQMLFDASPRPASPMKSARRSPLAYLAPVALLMVMTFSLGWWSARSRQAPTPISMKKAKTIEHRSEPKTNPSNGASPQRPERPGQGKPQPVMYVTLRSGAEGRTRTIQLPVYERSSLPNDWLPFSEPVLPSEIQHQLREVGYNVITKRKLYAFTGSDNGPVLMPVESILVKNALY